MDITPRDRGSRGWADEKAEREHVIESDVQGSPSHRKVNLAPEVWPTIPVDKLVCALVDGLIMLNSN